jgi:hypothetical protein
VEQSHSEATILSACQEIPNILRNPKVDYLVLEESASVFWCLHVLRIIMFSNINMLRAFENRILSRTLEPKTEEVTGGWREQHTRILCTLKQIQKMRWAGNVAQIAETRHTTPYIQWCVWKIPVWKITSKTRWLDNIKIDMTETM